MNSDVKLIFRSSLKTQDHNTCIVCCRAGLIGAKCHGQKDVIKPIFSHFIMSRFYCHDSFSVAAVLLCDYLEPIDVTSRRRRLAELYCVNYLLRELFVCFGVAL